MKCEEVRDSLREEIFQNLNENLTEHEVVRWTVTGLPLTAYGLQGDTVKVERVTERTRNRDNIATYKTKKEDVRTVVVRDTVYVERRDSNSVESLEFRVESEGGRSGNTALHGTLKWVFWIIVSLTGLTIARMVMKRFY